MMMEETKTVPKRRLRRWVLVVLLLSGVALLPLLLSGDFRAAPFTSTRGSGSSRWGANYFPNVHLVTHEGKPVRFFDDVIKDKIVLINFIYTSCPDACPMDTARLKNVQQILGDRVGKDIFLYSITIDPGFDTPEVLAQYAKKFQAGPGWLFLTGNASDILMLRKKLGLYMDDLDHARKDHNMGLIMGNQSTGQWMKRSPMDSPYFLAEQLGSWLSNWKMPSQFSANNYANAPSLQVPSMGENLYRTRCAACHTIGAGDIRMVGGGENIEANQHRAGPDLIGVTQKRDRAWLARWIANPEKMLAERDPVIMKLYFEYEQVLMPNFRLNEVEVNALIDYMDTESRRVLQAQRVAGAEGSGSHADQ